MASPLEEKIRGNKKSNYASSSEDEGEEKVPGYVPQPMMDGMPQTGPKGVLNDYRRFKYEERLARAQEEKKKVELINKMAFTVKPKSEEDETDGGKSSSKDLLDTLEQLEIDGGDPFMQQYRAQRIQQMKEQAKTHGKKRRMFGNLTELRGDKYAVAIDSAPPDVFVIIHIYDEFFITCVKLNRCLADLAKKYPTVKFCRIQSHQLELSKEFQEKGLPAILVYKSGNMIGNLLRVTDTLGESFKMNDIEDFLHDNNCLPSNDEARILGAYNLSPRPSVSDKPSDTDDDEL
ncbi:PREDICTED: phosducin-like protein [Amphimedon queenslandica]|nr:PREDICTED: phosducin-like protein [Amphimedon queenslandica]|eukprot:XP_019851966.1 PREDICTED: phosducin-like protein [Amphimedon queenslandica]